MTATFLPMNAEVMVQFGNPSDSSGYNLSKATLLGERIGGFMAVYLVRLDDLFGIASKSQGRIAETSDYYCTQAMRLVSETGVGRFTAEEISYHLGVPKEAIVLA